MLILLYCWLAFNVSFVLLRTWKSYSHRRDVRHARQARQKHYASRRLDIVSNAEPTCANAPVQSSMAH